MSEIGRDIGGGESHGGDATPPKKACAQISRARCDETFCLHDARDCCQANRQDCAGAGQDSNRFSTFAGAVLSLARARYGARRSRLRECAHRRWRPIVPSVPKSIQTECVVESRDAGGRIERESCGASERIRWRASTQVRRTVCGRGFGFPAAASEIHKKLLQMVEFALATTTGWGRLSKRWSSRGCNARGERGLNPKPE